MNHSTVIGLVGLIEDLSPGRAAGENTANGATDRDITKGTEIGSVRLVHLKGVYIVYPHTVCDSAGDLSH